MSKKLPTISVTAEQHSNSSSSSHDSDSNDMDYGRNSGGVTDVEDFDSQAEVLKLSSRRGSGSVSPRQKTQLQKSKPFENDVTDVEDYETDSDDEEKSIAYPELKLSLREFLQQGHQNQEAVDNDAKESCEIRAGNFLQAQNLNGLADYLTDCEDYDTDSEVGYGCEKSVCVDLDNAVGDQGRVNIADGEKHEDDSDHYEDVSVISDISDLASAMSDCTGIGIHVRGMSEDEVLMVSGSGSEEVCQIACSSTESESGGAAGRSASISEASLPPIDVAFVNASGEPRRNSKSIFLNTEQRHFLQVTPKNDEVLTDIEGIDDSGAEDSFDNEDDNEEPIPRAIILAIGDDGTCLTDVEDMCCDDLSLTSAVPEAISVAPEVLPQPHREVVELKEDKYGDTITNVMPMKSNYEFGIPNHLKDVNHTDSEEYSCMEDVSATISLAEELAVGSPGLIENEVIVSNELLKQQNKRLEVLSNAESVTDVEEIFVAGTNRRKKLKTRTLSKGKNKLLDVVKGNEAGVTDVEDMELSECDLPPGVKRVAQLKHQAKGHNADKLTDAEDISTDDVSDASEASLPPAELPKQSQNKSKSHPLHLRLRKDDAVSQQNTDIEDVQLPSDAEDALEPPEIKVANSNSKELNDMLNESYTVVHERSGRSFNAEAEKLHIKGVIRDAHTDVEYVESDESAARGGN
ncbi:uncharacterized protein [Drosophila virilis]|uniref:Uncharacterized protein, isoform A n=1 Tax=Drosophila virilis TaxID=7244 RepID=A0A0Q9WX68_DROVI|nr:uncharacterized protein LOC26530701 [Drosophila virilis]KRF84964.1 uncharacterized protein Dvir_GJ25931, isoform A [Drosophila virilis]KRF84965.1 uncharacterized protein Dvir_GJ25931, isoform B [Drosophila virilis]